METAHARAPRLVTLSERDARVLVLIGRRQIDWDPISAVRIIAGQRAIACYVVLPMDVMCMVAIPAEVSAAAVDSDATVALSSFVTGIEEALSAGREICFDMDGLPMMTAPVGQGLTLAQLPPRDGWQMPIHGVSSDITPMIEEAVTEFRQRTAGMSERNAAPIAEEIWSRTAWAGLPMRSLHAARRLRLMTDEPLRVTAATCGPWKRLSTPRGQLFTYSAGIEARLGLHIVR